MNAQLDTSLAYKYFVAYRLFDGQRFDEVVIPYAPTRRIRRIFKRLLAKEKQAWLTLCLLLGLSTALFQTALPALIVIALASSLAGILPFYQWQQATHIGLSRKGYKQYYIHWFGDKATPIHSWEKIKEVRLQTVSTKFGEASFIELIDQKNQVLFKLALDGIKVGEHRRRLLGALTQFLPEEKLEFVLRDALNPVKLNTFTSLWLEILSNSPKRIREDSLSADVVLGNGRYKILELLGVGGQGSAYLATRLSDEGKEGLQVTLKEFVLPSQASLNVSQRAFEQIKKEADLLEKVSHNQIVSLIDFFVDDHRAYLVLEHVPGRSLRQIVRENGPMSEMQVCDLALEMCNVLEHLHGLTPPVIHRDFTPDNLILGPDGELKLIDFAVAQQLESSATRTVVGKHSYIPPEQFRGRSSLQSDLYALGATLYFLLCGEDPEPIRVAHPVRANPLVTTDMDFLVAHCTEQELDNRAKSITEIKEGLIKHRERLQGEQKQGSS